MQNKIMIYFNKFLEKVTHTKDLLVLASNIGQQQNYTQSKSLLKLLIYQ